MSDASPSVPHIHIAIYKPIPQLAMTEKPTAYPSIPVNVVVFPIPFLILQVRGAYGGILASVREGWDDVASTDYLGRMDETKCSCFSHIHKAKPMKALCVAPVMIHAVPSYPKEIHP